MSREANTALPKCVNGWRSELAAFRKTQEGREFFQTASSPGELQGIVWKQFPKLPISRVLDLAELHFKFEEIHWALKQRAKWGDTKRRAPDDPADIGEAPPCLSSSAEANRTLYLFRDWYAMKVACPYNQPALDIARQIACLVAQGEFSAVRSQEAIDWALDQHPSAVSPA